MTRFRMCLFFLICIASSLSYAQAPILSDENPVITPQNAMQVTQLAMIGRGYPRDVAFSPDGKLLAIGTSIGVWIYDANNPATMPRLLTDINQQQGILDIDFSPDGRFIAAGTGGEFYEWGDNALIVWDVESGEVVHHIPAHTRPILDVAYHPDGLTIATTSRDGQLYIWDAQTGALLNTLPTPDTETPYANALAYSPDGQFIASAHGDAYQSTNDKILIRDVNTDEVIYRVNHLSYALAYSPDGQFLASGRYSLSVLNTQTGELVGEIDPTPDENALYNITEIEFSADGQSIMTSHSDGFLRIYDAQTLAERSSIPFYDTMLSGFAYRPDDQHLVVYNSVNDDKVFWSDIQGNVTYTDSFNRRLSQAIFSPDLQTIYYGEDYRIGALAVDSLTSYQPTMDGQTITHLAFQQIYPLFFFITPNTQQMTIITQPYGMNTENGTVVLNLETGDVSHYIQTPPRILNAYYDDVRQWLTTATFNQLYVHDVNTTELLQIISSDVVIDGFIYDDTENHLIVSQANAKVDNLFDVRLVTYDFNLWWGSSNDEWTVVSSVELNNTFDTIELGMTPDKRIIGSYQNPNAGIFTIEDMDTNGKTELTTDTGMRHPQFSPDGRLVMVESGRFILLWDAQNGDLLTTLHGHTDWVRAEWRADGRAIISTGDDGTIRVWGVPAQSE